MVYPYIVLIAGGTGESQRSVEMLGIQRHI
jgi:hypothetical protein